MSLLNLLLILGTNSISLRIEISIKPTNDKEKCRLMKTIAILQYPQCIKISKTMKDCSNNVRGEGRKEAEKIIQE